MGRQQPIGLAVFFFVIALLIDLVLSGLVPINIVLFEPSGDGLDTDSIVLHLLQSAKAQENDEEENKDRDERKSNLNEANESNKVEGNLSIETDFSELAYLTSIDICCSWDDRLADGKLTYKIEYNDEEGGNNNNYLELKNAVKAAIKEWNIRVPNLELVDISATTSNSSVLSKNDADIEVRFQDVSMAEFERGSSGQIAGVTTMTYDNDGFISKSMITLPKTTYAQYNSQKLKEVSIHEIGHALGIGHANFEGDIMNQNVNYDGIASISDCDIEAISEANHWKLIYNTTTPVSPTLSNINC